MTPVSVITPTTMSRRNFWPGLLKSFVDQTYGETELIFVADTVEEMVALNELANTIAPDDFVTVISGGATLGDKRNMGCSIASPGSIVAHWDDDDLFSPGRIADQVATLEQSGLAVTGYTSAIVHELRTVKKRFAGEWRKTSGWYELHADEILGGSLAYRKDFWSAHPFQSIDIGEDTAFIKAASNESQAVAGSNGLDYYCLTNHHANTSGRCITDACIELPHGGTWAHLSAARD